MMTVRELAMLNFMDNVTDKADWHLKVITSFSKYFPVLKLGSRSTTIRLPKSGKKRRAPRKIWISVQLASIGALTSYATRRL